MRFEPMAVFFLAFIAYMLFVAKTDTTSTDVNATTSTNGTASTATAATGSSPPPETPSPFNWLWVVIPLVAAALAAVTYRWWKTRQTPQAPTGRRKMNDHNRD